MQGKDIVEQSLKLLNDRHGLVSLWQEVADNFYVERADFLVNRHLGTDFASQLTTSYPTLVRRELATSISSMLRPKGQPWFEIKTGEEEINEMYEPRVWMEWATQTQRRAMYDRVANLVRATKEGDQDYVTFGQTVITCEPNYDKMALLFRCWHLRDVAWEEGGDGQICKVVHRWRPYGYEIMQKFGDKVSSKLKQEIEKKGGNFRRFDIYRMVIKAEVYDNKKFKNDWISIHCEPDGNILEEVNIRRNPYIIPRWQTVSGSQYAFSPAVVAALPDARLLQAITLTLLESSEKAANPSMIAVEEMIKSDIDMLPGGVTWVDASYDEKTGAVLRPINQDFSGLPAGFQMQDKIENSLIQAFYLDKIKMPMLQKEATAYEVSQMVEQYVRNALPLFEPMEAEYNGQLCETAFYTLLDMGTFGPPESIPQELQGREIEFKFTNPLHDNEEKLKTQNFAEARAIIAEAAALDPAAPSMLNVRKALRESLHGAQVPADWLRSDEEMEEMATRQAQQEQQQMLMQQMQQGAETAEQIGRAGQALRQGGMNDI